MVDCFVRVGVKNADPFLIHRKPNVVDITEVCGDLFKSRDYARHLKCDRPRYEHIVHEHPFGLEIQVQWEAIFSQLKRCPIDDFVAEIDHADDHIRVFPRLGSISCRHFILLTGIPDLFLYLFLNFLPVIGHAVDHDELPALAVHRFNRHHFMKIMIGEVIHEGIFDPIDYPGAVCVRHACVEFCRFVFSDIELFIHQIQIAQFLEMQFQERKATILSSQFTQSLFRYFIIAQFFQQVFPVHFKISFCLKFMTLKNIIFIHHCPPPFQHVSHSAMQQRFGAARPQCIPEFGCFLFGQ